MGPPAPSPSATSSNRFSPTCSSRASRAQCGACRKCAPTNRSGSKRARITSPRRRHSGRQT
eukprot:449143-Lingulodinium_polyedra.AAC.1